LFCFVVDFVIWNFINFNCYSNGVLGTLCLEYFIHSIWEFQKIRYLNFVSLQVQHFIFVVQAQDTGRPSLSSTVTVYFNVLDLNDNAPLFDPMSYSDELYENITVGSSVITVSATDQDSG